MRLRDPMQTCFIASLIAATFLFCQACTLKEVEIESMQFCPGDFESEARSVLNIQDVSTLTTEELFSVLTSNNVTYEVASQALNPHKCESYEPIENAKKYKVYAGFDENGNHTRNFLIVADSEGKIKYIEKIYAYKVP